MKTDAYWGVYIRASFLVQKESGLEIENIISLVIDLQCPLTCFCYRCE